MTAKPHISDPQRVSAALDRYESGTYHGSARGSEDCPTSTTVTRQVASFGSPHRR